MNYDEATLFKEVNYPLSILVEDIDMGIGCQIFSDPLYGQQKYPKFVIFLTQCIRAILLDIYFFGLMKVDNK